MKAQARVLGFDDAPFQRSDAQVDVVGVAMRGGAYVEAVLHGRVTRDGDDATEVLAHLVQGYRGRTGLGAVLLQNVVVAGFNVVDLGALAASTGVPVVAVARGGSDADAVAAALRHVPGGEAKWSRFQANGERSARHDGGVLWWAGCREAEAVEWARMSTVRGHLPEPLRLAHLIGAGWVMGQSKGQ